VANFSVSNRSVLRFINDFLIAPISPHVPTAEELAFLSSMQQVLDLLAEDEAKDSTVQLRDRLRAARRDWRVTTAARLRSVADAFAADPSDPKSGVDQIAAIRVDYIKAIPDIAIQGVSAETASFQGEFTVSCSYARDAAEQAFLDRLKAMFDFLAAEEIDDKRKAYSDAVVTARKAQRADTSGKLRENAIDWRRGLKSEVATNNILVFRGGYKALCERLGHSLFSIFVVRGKDAGEADPLDQDVVVDLRITLAQGLPSPNDVASPEKQDLFVQINNACATVRTVCQQIREQSKKLKKVDKIEAARKRARRLQDEYITKLAGVGRLGLEGPHTALAKLALNSLKSEFVAQEAGRIKNRYLRVLGYWSAGFAIALLLGHIWIRATGCALPSSPAAKSICIASWWDVHRNFLLAASSAAVGTWVSFAVRRLDLPFEEIALLEEESLDPPFRIVFVVALTLIVCLLFWTRAINIEIGNLRTAPDDFTATGSIAIVVGMFCGLSERALATAISGRAAAFVRGVAGG
jgi:hypothetical protein